MLSCVSSFRSYIKIFGPFWIHFLCKVRDRGLLSIFTWISSFPNTVDWTCYFSSMFLAPLSKLDGHSCVGLFPHLLFHWFTCLFGGTSTMLFLLLQLCSIIFFYFLIYSYVHTFFVLFLSPAPSPSSYNFFWSQILWYL
jgi:hypothetical protein